MDEDETRRPLRGGMTVTQRWVLVLAAIVAIGLVAYLRVTPGDDTVRDAVRAAADEIERTPVRGLGAAGVDVSAALARGAPRTSGLRVQHAGSDQRGDLYEITNRGDDHPVCLTVAVDANLAGDAPSFPTTTVADGRC